MTGLVCPLLASHTLGEKRSRKFRGSLFGKTDFWFRGKLNSKKILSKKIIFWRIFRVLMGIFDPALSFLLRHFLDLLNVKTQSVKVQMALKPPFKNLENLYEHCTVSACYVLIYQKSIG